MATPRDYNTTQSFVSAVVRTDYTYVPEKNDYSTIETVTFETGGQASSLREGFNTPNWRALLKQRSRLPDNPYNIRKRSASGSPFDSVWLFKTGEMKWNIPNWDATGLPANELAKPVVKFDGRAYWYCTGDQMMPPDIASHKANARQIAIQKALILLKDSKFNGAVAYNEAGQVHRLIGDSARKIAKALTDLKHGHLQLAMNTFGLAVSKRSAARYRHAMNRAKTDAAIETVLAQGVLTIQYGVRPLLNDIVGAAELYAQKVVGEVAADIRSSSTIYLDGGRSRKGSSNLNAYGTYWYMSSCKTAGSVRVSVKLRYTRGNEVTHTLAQLGITNPALVAWEALPWSFVIDWFIPIGNWISSLDATLGLVFESGSLSTKHAMTHTRGQVVRGAVYSSGSATYEDQGFTRERLTSFPSASFPSFKNPLSFEHALNGIALLVGVRNNLYK